MKKRLALLFLAVGLAAAVYGQSGTPDDGTELTVGKTATLGVEATTTFAWDIENESTGLETKVGIELIFPLFPSADRGIYPPEEDPDAPLSEEAEYNSPSPNSPSVRIALRNAAFTWWNTFWTTGGNYEQDSFNSWSARPLVLSFDSFAADVVWTNYFFRIASSTTVFQTDTTSLVSIFDEVMDARENRWYLAGNQALWRSERYNIQELPLLRKKIERDYIDEDYRDEISGMLAFGAEFEWFSATLKTASNKSGLENDDNAWLVGLDIELVPLENLLFTLTGFAGFNYEKTTVGKNPLNFGVSAEYQIPLSDMLFLTPQVGFDFAMDTAANESEWELGAGLLFNTRGIDYLTSSRVLDWDDVIPVGASFFINMNQDNGFNAMLSWFDPAGPDSLLPNFGGFLQLELANLFEANDSASAFAVLAQFEYMIAEKFTPYIRAGYIPEFASTSSTETKITDRYVVKGAIGCYMTPVHFFSIDLRYEMGMLLDTDGTESDKSLLSIAFTVRM